MPATLFSLETWQWLLKTEATPLLIALEELAEPDVASIERLRRDWPAESVAAGLELTRARRKARDKFPEAGQLVADVEGVEQATSVVVADHKAKRFAGLEQAPVLDLCCGIGGDAMSLARVIDVQGVDHDSVRTWMCEVNARCNAVSADVTALDLRGKVFHLDPSRRVGGNRRVWRFADYRPGPEFITDLLARCPDGAVKLGPGVDLDDLPVAATSEIELISERGRLVQAVLWAGGLAHHPRQRTATRLPEGHSVTGTPAPPPVRTSPGFDRYLAVADPATERARLLGVLCDGNSWRDAAPGLGLLTSPVRDRSPWLSCFEVLDDLPWRLRRVREWLKGHDAGAVEVKTRGRAVDPDEAQRKLRGSGGETYTVFVVRVGKPVRAVMTRRLTDAD